MKKIFLHSFRFMLLLAVVQLAGCKKIIDKYFPGHGSGGDQQGCHIVQIKQAIEGSNVSRTGDFYYSNGNRLDSIIFDTGSAAAQLYYFDYDSNNKLIGYRTYYDRDPADYYFLHKYVYDGATIVRDTTWIREAGSYTQVSSFGYDGDGRLIKEWRTVIESEGQPANETEDPIDYPYDSDGNLQAIEGSTYDDKTNYISTSKVLQFTEKDYSKNNPSGATGYNDKSLPLGFAGASHGGFLQMSPPDNIAYQCQ